MGKAMDQWDTYFQIPESGYCHHEANAQTWGRALLGAAGKENNDPNSSVFETPKLLFGNTGRCKFVMIVPMICQSDKLFDDGIFLLLA